MHTRKLPERSHEPVIGLYHVQAGTLYEFEQFTTLGRPKHTIAIGRARYCDIKPADLAISLVHCMIYREADGTFSIEDCDSTNGTYVNYARIAKMTLHVGSWLHIGDSEFYVAGHNRSMPIVARTLTTFYARAAQLYGSSARAAEHVHKSAATIYRGLRRWKARAGAAAGKNHGAL